MVVKKELCFSKLSFYLLTIGTLAAIVVVSTGVLFTPEMSGAAGGIRETHALIAFVSLDLLVITTILRILQFQKPDTNNLKWISFVCYALATVAISATSHYGGPLVYNYMMPL
jgi:uncharacterized membrane protein